MRGLRNGWVVGCVFLVAPGGCGETDESGESATVFGSLTAGEIRPAEVNVKPALSTMSASTKLEAKGSKVQVVHGLKRVDSAGTVYDVRLVVGAPSLVGTEETGTGDLFRDDAEDAWDTARFDLASGVALAAIKGPPRPPSETEPEVFPPIMPIVIYEDIETGADGSLLLVWATRDYSTTDDLTDLVCHVGLISGGPARIRLPDDNGLKNIWFIGDRTALQVHVSNKPDGGKKYVVRHVSGEDAYNDGGAGQEDNLGRTGKDFGDFEGLKQVAERLESVIDSLRLE